MKYIFKVKDTVECNGAPELLFCSISMSPLLFMLIQLYRISPSFCTASLHAGLRFPSHHYLRAPKFSSSYSKFLYPFFTEFLCSSSQHYSVFHAQGPCGLQNIPPTLHRISPSFPTTFLHPFLQHSPSFPTTFLHPFLQHFSILSYNFSPPSHTTFLYPFLPYFPILSYLLSSSFPLPHFAVLSCHISPSFSTTFSRPFLPPELSIQ